MMNSPARNVSEIVRRRSGSFTDNMKLPVHRWFRYSAGFSAEWAESVIKKRKGGSGNLEVLDPFCGSGTTLLAACSQGVTSTGFEQHPFIARVARAKTRVASDTGQFMKMANAMMSRAAGNIAETPLTGSPLLLKCYSEENLTRLEALRTAFEEMETERRHETDLLWLALTSILRECSCAGTANCQYVLPNKSKARVADPFEAFENKVFVIANDLAFMRSRGTHRMTVLDTDARNPECDDAFDMVITSPPYPNNYDYADATRLEMTFWGDVGRWGDLHETVRRHLICSCSQHSAAEKLVLGDFIHGRDVDPIGDELSEVCQRLDIVRRGKGGRKTYHTMIAAYFTGMADVWKALRRLVRPGGTAAFVLGDSAPYGVHVPCDEWMGKLAVAAGFSDFSFEKLRDRNVKWKNRKHRVPLKEGILWVSG